ncbi:hypothetical protein OUZ56_026095 [Daphnia magna]|uniref:Uncharacterized protein n=1 Tax=Daphnia magna TaxID=35525 RepID=A0ABQ9ZLK9_9CRUS|nr:hypothetical protein OUZ56_026095 [Daphnia magna]
MKWLWERAKGINAGMLEGSPYLRYLHQPPFLPFIRLPGLATLAAFDITDNHTVLSRGSIMNPRQYLLPTFRWHTKSIKLLPERDCSQVQQALLQHEVSVLGGSNLRHYLLDPSLFLTPFLYRVTRYGIYLLVQASFLVADGNVVLLQRQTPSLKPAA